MQTSQIQLVNLDLMKWIENNKFAGFDPYDGLETPFFNKNLRAKWIEIPLIQFNKKSPINFRPALLIKRGFNPKGIGLILNSYVKLYNLYKKKIFLFKAKKLFEYLLRQRSKGYSGISWGYNFNYSTQIKYVKKNTPSIVVSSIIGKSIYEYFKATKDNRALEVLEGICEFILKDLPLTETENGLCFSYTPVVREVVHNANLLGAEILSYVFTITKDANLEKYAQRSLDFTLQKQNSDGSWYYREDATTGIPKKQIDFHQGYILCSIKRICQNINYEHHSVSKKIGDGLNFYIDKQFMPSGRSKWRWPRIWPVDIHNQSQGIITFSTFNNFNNDYLNFSMKIAEWTIDNMLDQSGYFYYQKWPLLMNKIPYMRWSQAWMFLALSTLLEKYNEAIS